MPNITCPTCGDAKMETKEIRQFETEFEGITIHVPNARVSECPSCGEKLYSAKELNRWKEIKQATLAKSGALPNGNDVKEVREHLGLTASQFADLVAVTRQTVHSWERESDQPMKLGPAALIVKLLKQAQCGQAVNVAADLVELATMRGKSISCDPRLPTQERPLGIAGSTCLRPDRPSGSPGFSARAA